MYKFFATGFLILLWSTLMVLLFWEHEAALRMFPPAWRENSTHICKSARTCKGLSFSQRRVKASDSTGLHLTIQSSSQEFAQLRDQITQTVPEGFEDRIEFHLAATPQKR